MQLLTKNSYGPEKNSLVETTHFSPGESL